jgi:hypothetical protein
VCASTTVIEPDTADSPRVLPDDVIAVRIHLWSLWIGLSRLLPPLVVSGDSTANALAKALAVSFDQPRWTAPAHT